jgi:Fic family protein
MIDLNQAQQIILKIFIENGSLASSSVHAELLRRGNEVSLITVKRELSELKSKGLLEGSGAGRSVKYGISNKGRLVTTIDVSQYCAKEPDQRFGLRGYNFSLLESISPDLFTSAETKILTEATKIYRTNIKDISSTLNEKELERFVIELSWKSSRIEGNTYTLLDTEKLIRQGTEALGHNKNETRMILNHKEAFKFIREQAAVFKEFSLVNLEAVHKILVKDMDVNYGLRSKPVGVTGSIYRPLDNSYQVREALQSLAINIGKIDSPYGQSLITLLGISYIQPFEDGNKRTSRLMANAALLANNCAPLSYRSVDENEYREATLVFYELNSLMALKKIFVEQYDFAARNYAMK